ncbi:MAG: hypothetical protein ACREID_03600, partial [Planctomycetota bacterium]
MILMAVLLFALSVMALSVSVIASGMAVNNQKRYLVAAQVAQEASESGVNRLFAGLQSPQRPVILAAGGLDEVLRGTPSTQRAVRYSVRVTPALTDGADNDLDGRVDESDEEYMLEVASTGRADDVGKTVRVTMRTRYVTPDTPVYFDDPLATVDLRGTTLVSGFNVDLNGTNTGYTVPALGVGGDPANIENQAMSFSNRLEGAGGIPSVAEAEKLPFDLMHADATLVATVRLNPGVYSSTNINGAWGTQASPRIVAATGPVKIQGSGTGWGTLVVNGDLEITGSFKWFGLVIVKGDVRFTGSQNPRVQGGLMVRGDVLAVGAVEIKYS